VPQNANKINLQRCFERPRLYRSPRKSICNDALKGHDSSQRIVPDCRRLNAGFTGSGKSPAATLFVSGHDFSRAASTAEWRRALAPEGCISSTALEPSSFSAAPLAPEFSTCFAHARRRKLHPPHPRRSTRRIFALTTDPHAPCTHSLFCRTCNPVFIRSTGFASTVRWMRQELAWMGES
jgi:hypothetical protein